MSDDSVGEVAAAVEPKVEPYTPFPMFADWLSDPPSFDALNRYVVQLHELRESSTPERFDAAAGIATRWAAINTGAIEGLYEVDRGFTYSVAVSAVAWDQIHLEKGQFAASSMADALDAYEFVLDAATRAHPITEVWVRELHAKVAASQKTYTVITAVGQQEQDLAHGVYKTYPNNPLNFRDHKIHGYASPLDTPAEMSRLIDEIRRPEFMSAAPIMQAAYAHYAFVAIHPFADGNGRVARALASTFLYRHLGLPLVIFQDQKADYLNGLELADKGEPTTFVRFIAERVIDTIGMVREQILTAALPDVDTQIGDLTPLLTGHGGLPHEEIDAIAVRVLEAFGVALAQQVSQTTIPAPLSAETRSISSGVSLSDRPSSYRAVPGYRGYVQMVVASNAPAASRAEANFYSLTRLPTEEVEDFVIVAGTGLVVMSMELREVYPEIGQALRFRMEAVAQRMFRTLTINATRQAENSLREAGYV